MIASMVAIMHSVAPQQTVIWVSGSQSIPLNAAGFGGDGLPQDRHAPGDGVLIEAVANRLAGRLLDDLRRVEVGHPLAEIDRAMLLRDRGSSPEWSIR